VLAWWLSVTAGIDLRGIEDGEAERLRGRLVTRLRAAADGDMRPPPAALRRVLDALREIEQLALS
jgi:hypothetical protein